MYLPARHRSLGPFFDLSQIWRAFRGTFCDQGSIDRVATARQPHATSGSARDTGSANRSPSHIEPVSGMPKRKLENGERRLAPQSHRVRSRKSGICQPETRDASIASVNTGRGKSQDVRKKRAPTPNTQLREPVSVTYRTGLGHAETEIGKWRAETGAAKPPVQSRKSGICRPETRARQHNPRECRRFSHTPEIA